MHRTYFNNLRSSAIFWVLISSYIIFFGYISWLQYQSFKYEDFDLAVHSQALWSILHGSINSSILDVDFLGNHAHLILFFIAPIYLIFKNPLTLLFLQTLSLGLAAYPIYLIAKRELDEHFALAVAFAYLVYPALGYTNLFEFHPTAFATLFLSLMLYYFVKEDFKYFVIFMLLSLLCQENIPLIIIPQGIYTFFIKRSARWSLIPILTGIIWLWVSVTKIIPYYNKGTIEFSMLYGHLGSSAPQIAKHIITNPLRAMPYITTPLDIKYILDLLTPLSFLPLCAPQILIILPVFLQHLFSLRFQEHAIYWHYAAEMTPIIFFSAIYGIKKAMGISIIRRYLKRDMFIIIFIAIAVSHSLCVGPLTQLIGGYRVYIKDKKDCQKENFLARIPPDAGVVATFEFLPRLSHRKNLYSFHHVVLGYHTLSTKPYLLPKEAEYGLLDFRDNVTFNRTYVIAENADVNLRNFMRDGNWGVVDMADSIVLLKKNYKSKYALYKSGLKEPKIHHRVNATAAGELEFLGYNVNNRYRDDSEKISLTLCWRILKPATHTYISYIEIIDNKGSRYSLLKPICYWIYPPTAWRTGEIVSEDYILSLPEQIGHIHSVRIGVGDYRKRIFFPFVSLDPQRVDSSGLVILDLLEKDAR